MLEGAWYLETINMNIELCIHECLRKYVNALCKFVVNLDGAVNSSLHSVVNLKCFNNSGASNLIYKEKIYRY